MPIIRNPFRKQDENLRPLTVTSQPSNGSLAKPLDIPEKEPTEYKLSEINDSGVYLPPSPPERKGFWHTSSSRSTTSSNHRSVFNENEQFNISRESFDSYRRSFDISARSPILNPAESRPRASLDSRTFERPERPAPRSSLDVRAPPPRSSNSFNRPSQVPARTNEDAFEDVDIGGDEPKPQPKKRGLFARMVDGAVNPNSDSTERPISSEGGTPTKSSWHHFGNRKRGQSGQGAELGAIKPELKQVNGNPSSQLKTEVPVDGENTGTESLQTPEVRLREATPEAPAASMESLDLGDKAMSSDSSTQDAEPSQIVRPAPIDEAKPSKNTSAQPEPPKIVETKVDV